MFGWQGGEKCWHLAVQQQLPLHLELLLQQLLLCCLLVPELKHLVVGIVFSFISMQMKTVINSMATNTMAFIGDETICQIDCSTRLIHRNLDPHLPMEQLVMLTKGSDCSLC